jgi:hypothetical protein
MAGEHDLQVQVRTVRRALVLSLAIALGGCNRSPGQVSVVFSFVEGEPDHPELLWAHLHAEAVPEATATSTGAVGINLGGTVVKLVPGKDFTFSVKNGPRRVVFAELRDGPDPLATRVLYYGRSEPFDLEAGESITVRTELDLVRPPAFQDPPLVVRGASMGTTSNPTVEVEVHVVSVRPITVEIANDAEFTKGRSDPRGRRSSSCGPGCILIEHNLDADLCGSMSCPDGPRTIYARATSIDGYASGVASIGVELDQTPPSIVPGSVHIALTRAPVTSTSDWVERTKDLLMPTISAVRAGTMVHVAFALSEDVETPTVATSRPDVIHFHLVSRMQNAFTYAFELDDRPHGQGAYEVRVVAVDRAGNMLDDAIPLPLPGLVVDTLPPPPGRTFAAGFIVLDRAPWGRFDSAVPVYHVRGRDGAIEPGATAIAFLDPLVATSTGGFVGREITRATANERGAFDMPFDQDHDSVYLLVIDGAGNMDANVGFDGVIRAEPIIEGVWHASPAFRGAAAPPHKVHLVNPAMPTLNPPTDATVEVEPPELPPLAAPDGMSISSEGARTLLRLTHGLVPSPMRAAMVYVPARGGIFTYAWTDGSAMPPAAQYEWTRQGWATAPNVTALPLPGRESMALDRRGRVVAVVGYPTMTWVWNGTIWQSLAPGPDPANSVGLLAYDAVRGETVFHAVGSTWTWDGARWTMRSSSASGDDHTLGMVYDPDLRAVVRASDDGTYAWDGARWNLIGGTFPASNPPNAFAMAYDERRRVIVAFDGLERSTYEWDGSTWRTSAAIGAPTARFAFGFAYDPSRREVILFGGALPNGSSDPIESNDTYAYDGRRWLRLDPLAGPSPRIGQGMAADDNGRITMFGGRRDAQSSPSRETWIYEAGTWRQLAITATAPPGRSFFGMAYDSARMRTVLFGGSPELGALFSSADLDRDTWEFDGLTWTRTATLGPPGRIGAPLTYDPIRRRTLVYGGGYAPLLQDLWAWDGSAWSAIPQARAGRGRRPRGSSSSTRSPAGTSTRAGP